MKGFDTSRVQGFLVGQVIAASVGILMLLVDDFGGFYYRDYYNHIDVYGYVYLGSGVLSTVLILLGGWRAGCGTPVFSEDFEGRGAVS